MPALVRVFGMESSVQRACLSRKKEKLRFSVLGELLLIPIPALNCVYVFVVLSFVAKVDCDSHHLV